MVLQGKQFLKAAMAHIMKLYGPNLQTDRFLVTVTINFNVSGMSRTD